MHFSDEDIIAFVLNDADDELVQNLKAALSGDSDLYERVAHFRQLLGYIDSLGGVYEPPSQLVESTLDRIEASEAERSIQPASRQAASGLSAPLAGEKSRGSTAQKRIDTLVLTACLALVCCLLLPAVVTARFTARKNGCAQNLQYVGQCLNDFTMFDQQQRYPRVELTGSGSFAGVFAVTLKSGGEDISYSQLLCPSLNGCDEGNSGIVISAIPTFVELERLTASELAQWRQVIGGNYAYSLGVVERGKIVAPRCEGRSNFAILADSPVFLSDGEEFIAHDGRGINILYEDGRVQFVRIVGQGDFGALANYPFQNLRKEHAMGLTKSDDSLAPSGYSPLGVR
ncbi:MAG: anti-sigma factor [Pirellulaceae bacterium]